MLYNATPMYILETYSDIAALKGTPHRVLFQNGDGNINLGVFFNDPDIEMKDIYWYNILAQAIRNSLALKEGLVSIDEKLNVMDELTLSCYVELHRNGKSDFIN